ncbi:hypothetical protein GCM10023172_25170 [Hymenobacter ginsengisoli]|uniref:STAS domain-containing protein n=1 Tax=Hymenobacter ginsengisoli TaxID=1051626 RepID=A0ABP8QI73_9BACT|nr:MULTISPECIES: STAS domain-containing protein [unclassified Hymenobacter]MBO2030224.1 STAS domain-containing protein [Hymenobacter sp. BT559]
MLIAYYELLPQAYLLVPAHDPTTSELPLAWQLRCAMRSGKRAVWVDCRLLHTLSATAIRLLHACHRRLQRQQAQLVLCHVPARLAHSAALAELYLAPTYEEAAALQRAQAG